VQAGRALPLDERLELLLEGGRPLVNLSGMNRPRIVTEAVTERLFTANVDLPRRINAVARRTGSTVIHLSSGELDGDSAAGMLAPAAWADLAGDAESRAVRLVEALGEEWWERHDAYQLSKIMLESACASQSGVVCVRLSNVVGPHYRRQGFLPRIIRARLRGESVRVPNERRNWADADELNGFLAAIAAEPPSRVVVPGYGSHDLASGELVALIEELLPTCYGTVSVNQEEFRELSHPHLERLRDFVPSLPTTPTAEVIWRTVREWRSGSRYRMTDFSSAEKMSRGEPVPLERGGSIAHKSILANGTITKSSDQPGFEGAGAAKLAAEAGFYRWLRGAGGRGLSRLYPKLIAHQADPTSTSLTLELVGDGRTLADSLSQGLAFPSREVESVIDEMFRHSYLSDLHAVSVDQGQRLLDTLYLARTVDRLLGFTKLIEDHDVDRRLREVVDAIVAERSIRINGRLTSSPLTILRSFASGSRERLRPRALGTCGHGDLTVLNLAWSSAGELKLIDPRGVVGPWDPLYDLAKLGFSLGGFAECIKNGLTVDGTSEDLQVETDVDCPGFAEGRSWLRGWLTGSLLLQPVRELEPYAELRIEFGEACHFLADVPYRLAQGMDSERALAVLLLGCERLAAVADELGDDSQVR
jgi:nucleoside-diphosphate-sugar epimerase